MKTRRVFPCTMSSCLCSGLVLLLVGSAVFTAPAQDFATPSEITNVWKYNQAGFELGGSSVASLAVVPDTAGPRPLQAVVLSTGLSNIIHVLFDEFLYSGVENRTTTNDYRIVVAGTTNQFVAITNVQLTGSSVLLRVGPDNWRIGGDYYLILNNVRDSRGNVIAPNTRIAISWPRSAMLVRITSEWRYHAIAQFDSQVYDANWTGTNYPESIFWGRDSGPFCAGPVFDTCLGECGLQIQFSYQPEPTLFRTTFVWPTNWPIKGQLRVRVAFDDGFALYLNGREIARSNVASSVTRMTPATRATANTSILCNTNLLLTVTNLFPGTNWLAAATVDSGSVGVTVFALEMQGEALVAPALPAELAPKLEFGSLDDGNLRLWWNGFGYTLESVTNLTDNAASAPLGPWQQVPRMTNPFTNTLSEPSRFFRLRK